MKRDSSGFPHEEVLGYPGGGFDAAGAGKACSLGSIVKSILTAANEALRLRNSHWSYGAGVWTYSATEKQPATSDNLQPRVRSWGVL